MNLTIQTGNKPIFIEGKMYENLKYFDCQGIQSTNFIGNIYGNTQELYIIKKYNNIKDDEIEALKLIRNQQNEIKPKCQHIIKIHGIQDFSKSREERNFYIVLELAKGNVLELIKNNTSLDLIQKLKIFEQMVKGVLELHNLGYFHRDLKPENFVYFQNKNNHYKVKLIDFGLVTKDSSVEKTQLCGTFDYMAPEVMEDEAKYDKSADNWSLGIILYELLTSESFQSVKCQKFYIQQMNDLTQEQINLKINKAYDLGQQEKDLIIFMLQKESQNRIKLEILLQKIDQYFLTIKEQEERKLIEKIELKEKKSSLIIYLQILQNTINSVIQQLTEQLKYINEIDTVEQKKQEVSTFINNELQKYQGKMKTNEQRQQNIQQAQTNEMIRGYDTELIQENRQIQQDSSLVIENIQKKIDFLIQQVKVKQQMEQQQIEQEQRLKMEQEQRLKIEQEYQSNKEQYQSVLTIVKQQLTQYSSQIKNITAHLTFYQEFQQQIQGQEKIQDVIQQHQQNVNDIQELESQEKIILQLDSLQQIHFYQSFRIKLEEIQQAQSRLKFQIEEANKSIQQIDTQFTNEHYKQIDEVNEKLDDFLDKFKYLSKHQKYANKIDQIINQIEVISGQLNSLKQLITKRTQIVYQQYNQTYDQIQQTLRDFQKYYNQLHEQICNDQQIEQKNIERIRKVNFTQDLLNSFKKKMNELQDQGKNLINNQYCKNEQIKNLINNKLIKMDQNIIEYQKQFDNLNQFNQLNSCEIINNQILKLEEFQNKLNEVEVNEIEQVDQLKLIIQKIAVENKNEQEREIVNLNNQLLNKYKQYSKSLKSIKFQFESIEFYQQMNEKKWILYNQLKQEIRILEDYSRVQHENAMLFKQQLEDIQKRQGQLKERIEDLLKKMYQTNLSKGYRLENVFNRVFNKKLTLNFIQMDDNLIQNCEQLKMQEVQQSIKVNTINERISNQQLNSQQLNELKEQILKACSTIDDLIMKIPQNNEIQQFNTAYQQNLESYQNLYALVNYIKQFHLTRYYERMKESLNQQKKNKQNNNESDYKKLFQSKLIVGQEDHTKKEKEAQDILQQYEYALTDNQNMIPIEVMEKYKEQLEKETVEIEYIIKSKNLVKLRSNLKDQLVIKEIINNKQYYKITELSQMLIFKTISENKNQIPSEQSNPY